MLKRATYLLPLLIGLAIASLISAGYYAEQDRHIQKTRLQVFYKLSTIQSGFENALNNKLHLANALKSFIGLNPDIDQEEFARLAREMAEDVGGIHHLELARDNVITHVYPQRDSAQIMGRDLLNDFPSDIKHLTKKAMTSRQEQILSSGKGLGKGDTIIAATPVYINEDGPKGVSRYWGLIVVLIDTNALYREAGFMDVSPELELALRKPETDPGRETLLIGKQSTFDMDPVLMNIPIPNGYWQVAAVPARGWPISPNKPYIIGGGLVGTLMITVSLWAVLLMIQGRLKDRERYRYLVHNARSIILRINMAGEITFCNEHAEAFYGYDPGELIGRPLIGTLVPKRNMEGESMKRYINRLLKNPAAHPFNESINVRKNGEMVWVSWANDSVLDSDERMVELLCVGTDITDRKLMEEALRQREKQYRLLAENASDIIWGLDADSRITFISPSDEALRGFKRQNVLGQPISFFLTPSSDRRLTNAMKNLESQIGNQKQPPASTIDLEFICVDGATVWLETHLVILLNENGDKVGMQGVGRDITDRKLAEALRDDMERIARHDLKTPLGAVVGLPEEIRRLGGLTPIQEGMLSTIENAGNAMLQLINRSLDLFKMERGTYILKKKTIDVLHILETIKVESLPIIRGKGISVGIEVRGELPEDRFWATAEEDLFKSMLSNLVLNALQASPEGGSVSIILKRDENISITIRNPGEVPTALRDTFFDKYSSSDGSDGSGLGTYSARLIARTHGGDVTLDSDIPGETSVIINLPE